MTKVGAPVVPDFAFDPRLFRAAPVEGWKYTYSEDLRKLIEKKVELQARLGSAIEEYDEPLKNAVWRWNEIMWIIHWWRERETEQMAHLK